MGTQVTVICVALICGLFSPIYGKLGHSGKETLHNGGAHHEVHKTGAHHPSHPHHHNTRHTLNSTNELDLPHKIPDLLDVASEALAYGDAYLKKHIQNGNVDYPSLKIMLIHVEAVKETLEKANFTSVELSLFQSAMGLLLKRLIEDIKYVMSHVNADEGHGIYDMGLGTPKVEPIAHNHHMTLHQKAVAPKYYIPVTWEALHPDKVKHALPAHHTHVKHVLPVHLPVLTTSTVHH